MEQALAKNRQTRSLVVVGVIAAILAATLVLIEIIPILLFPYTFLVALLFAIFDSFLPGGTSLGLAMLFSYLYLAAAIGLIVWLLSRKSGRLAALKNS